MGMQAALQQMCIRDRVHKADRKMYLFHNEKVLKAYDIGLGFDPVGHKQFEGCLLYTSRCV